MITPTKEHATEIIHLLRTYGICYGMGKPIPGQMCVEALVCYVLKLPHGDKPLDCVGEEVNKLKISLNDKPWTTNFERAKGMEQFAVAQLGSNTIDQKEFKDRFWLACGQQLAPLIFRYYAIKTTNEKKQAELNKHADEMEKVQTLREAKDKQKQFAYNYAYAYAYAYAYNYGYAYAYAYAYNYVYAYDYNYGYNYAYAYDYGYDVWLTKVANIATQVLIDMKSPGYKFLYLCEQVQL